MGAGTFVAAGTATIPAGTPGAAGYIDVAIAAVAATDRVSVSISDIDHQDLSGRKREDISVQVVKEAGVGITIGANQKQNPAFKVDYLIFTGA
jgi:hypothetical protein